MIAFPIQELDQLDGVDADSDESKMKSEIEFLKYQGKHLEEFLKTHS